MADEAAGETSREIEIYGELGILPKVGVKVRLARKARVERMITSAASHARLDPGQLQERFADSDDQLRDVVVLAALRAEQVEDNDYLDVLGRLIAGALDPAKIDEMAVIASEIVSLDPVHLRALFGFFHFGREGEENAQSDLGPADAAWATNRYRTDREIAYLLHLTRETSSQVLFRLDRDGLIHLHGGPLVDGETTTGPRDWAGRVLSFLFTPIRVEFRSEEDDGDAKVPSSARTVVTPPPAAFATRHPDSFEREQRAISALEDEIKASEKSSLSPVGFDITGVEARWLDLLKRRLRKIDPDNPWAYTD